MIPMPDAAYHQILHDRRARLQARAGATRLGWAALVRAISRAQQTLRGRTPASGEAVPPPAAAPADGALVTAARLAERLGLDDGDVVLEQVTTIGVVRREQDDDGRPRVVIELADEAVLPFAEEDLEALLEAWSVDADGVRASASR